MSWLRSLSCLEIILGILTLSLALTLLWGMILFWDTPPFSKESPTPCRCGPVYFQSHPDTTDFATTPQPRNEKKEPYVH